MRHLMSPLDFSVEELDRLMDLAGDIEWPIRTSMPMPVTARSLQLYYLRSAKYQNSD